MRLLPFRRSIQPRDSRPGESPTLTRSGTRPYGLAQESGIILFPEDDDPLPYLVREEEHWHGILLGCTSYGLLQQVLARVGFGDDGNMPPRVGSPYFDKDRRNPSLAPRVMRECAYLRRRFLRGAECLQESTARYLSFLRAVQAVAEYRVNREYLASLAQARSHYPAFERLVELFGSPLDPHDNESVRFISYSVLALARLALSTNDLSYWLRLAPPGLRAFLLGGCDGPSTDVDARFDRLLARVTQEAVENVRDAWNKDATSAPPSLATRVRRLEDGWAEVAMPALPELADAWDRQELVTDALVLADRIAWAFPLSTSWLCNSLFTSSRWLSPRHVLTIGVPISMLAQPSFQIIAVRRSRRVAHAFDFATFRASVGAHAAASHVVLAVDRQEDATLRVEAVSPEPVSFDELAISPDAVNVGWTIATSDEWRQLLESLPPAHATIVVTATVSRRHEAVAAVSWAQTPVVVLDAFVQLWNLRHSVEYAIDALSQGGRGRHAVIALYQMDIAGPGRPVLYGIVSKVTEYFTEALDRLVPEMDSNAPRRVTVATAPLGPLMSPEWWASLRAAFWSCYRADGFSESALTQGWE